MSTPPAFDPQPCCDGSDPVVTFADQFTSLGLCLGDGTPIGIINRRTDLGLVLQDGWVNLLTGAFTIGMPPVGTSACGSSVNIQTSDVLCDITTGDGVVHGLVLIQYLYAPDGSIDSTLIIDATTGAPYVPVGTVTVCPTDTGVPDNDMQILCDRQADGSLVPFVRDYRRDVNAIINGFSDYTLAGLPYVVTGTVQSCVPRVSDSAVLCDSNGTRFLRTYTYSSSGSVASFADTTLTGGPFVPVGAVGTCPVTATLSSPDLDFLEEMLCDGTGTPFIRRFTINSTTGVVTATVDLTLAGAPFVPSGAVGRCTTPVATDLDFVEELLCDSTGAQFLRRFTINSATGIVLATVDLTLAGGSFVPTGLVGTCPVTLSTPVVNAQGKALAATQSWTPGTDVTGTLTAVSVIVATGTVNIVDQNGTSVPGVPAGSTVTWSNDAEGSLLGPQSITANAASTAFVFWTQK